MMDCDYFDEDELNDHEEEIDDGPFCSLCEISVLESGLTKDLHSDSWYCDSCHDLENDPEFQNSIEDYEERRRKRIEEEQEY